MNKTKLLTCKTAAELLGFSTDYIRRLCGEGKIKAQMIGHNWTMTEKDIKHIKRQRKTKEE